MSAYLTPSRISLLERCPRRFFHAYVERAAAEAELGREADDDTSASLTGSLVHAVLEEAGRRHLANCNGGYMPADEAPVELAPILPIEAAKLGVLNPSIIGAAGKIIARLGRDLSFGALEAVEEKAKIVTPSWTVSMRIDRIDRILAGPAGGDCLLAYDYKSGRPRASRELAYEPQTLLYLAALRERDPSAEPPRIAYWYLAHDLPPITFRWSPQVHALAYQLADAAAERLARLEEARSRGEPYPAKPDHLECRSCPFRPLCPEYEAAAKIDETMLADPPAEALEAAVLRRQQLVSASKIADDAKKALDKRLLPILAERGEPLRVGGWRAVARTQKSGATSYDEADEEVVEVLSLYSGDSPEEVRRAISAIVGKRVSDFVSERIYPDQREEVERALERFAGRGVSTHVRVDRDTKGKARGDRR